jgi:hypothetical protein
MLFPILITDDFFKNPKEIVDFAKNLKYFKDEKGRWPGERSRSLHLIDNDFFNFVLKKIVSVLYPMSYQTFSWNAEMSFQKISKEYFNEGWIHQDLPAQISFIIYLSNHKECGTSFYENKLHYPKFVNNEQKEKIYKNKEIHNEKKYLEENNKNFIENITVQSKFNRLVLFDSSQFHAAKKFIEKDMEEDRLTLFGLFYSLSSKDIKYPCVENKRIL